MFERGAVGGTGTLKHQIGGVILIGTSKASGRQNRKHQVFRSEASDRKRQIGSVSSEA